jgi:hypothetical protein
MLRFVALCLRIYRTQNLLLLPLLLLSTAPVAHSCAILRVLLLLLLVTKPLLL